MSDKLDTDLQLKIYTLAARVAPLSYFQLELGMWTWSSPTYPDQDSCLAALRALLARLRAAGSQTTTFVVPQEEGCRLDLLAETSTTYEPPTFATQSEAEAVLEALCVAARADNLRVTYFSVDLAEDGAQPDYSSRSTDEPDSGMRVQDMTLVDNYFEEQVKGPVKVGVTRFSAELEGGKQHFFQISDGDCKVLLYSEGYESEAGRDNGLVSVLRNLTKELQYDFCVTPEETYFFRLIAENHQEIARSRLAASQAELEAWANWLRAQAPDWMLRCAPEDQREPGEEVPITFADDPPAPPVQEEEEPVLPPIYPKIKEEEEEPVLPPIYPKIVTGPPGVSPEGATSCSPDFHLLRPFSKGDVDRYFGREEDLEEVYDRIFDSHLFVIHGEQATGKTSLVQCGLANRLRETRWEMITIRREENLNDALLRKLRARAEELDCEDLAPDCGPEEVLQKIHDYSFQSTLLVFDELEELFMPPINLAEQQTFFLFVQRLIQNPELPAKVLLLVRDCYLAALTDYEIVVPTLLEHRHHLRHLPATSLPIVVDGLLTNLVAQDLIELPDPTAVTAKISNKLAGNKTEVGLACVQIYLHEAYQRSCAMKRKDSLPLFTPSLIEELDSPAVVTERYVAERVAELEGQLPKDQDAELTAAQAKEIEELVQLQNFCGCPEGSSRSTWLAFWHRRKGEITHLKYLLWLALLGMLLGALALGFTYCEVEQKDPCYQAQQSTSCEDWLNQYCQEDQESTCAEELRTLLDRENCPIWVDYQSTLATNTCDAFYTYVRTYREEGLCADYFYQLMMNRSCLTGRDTMRDTIPVYDTIPTPPDTITVTRIEYVPIEFEYRDTIKFGPPPGPCVTRDGTGTIRLGPIYMMTEDLNGGTRYDWVEALSACRRKGPGWRLPCASEIDFILDKHYSSAKSAYENLTQGACPLYNPEELSGYFWTATEANDDKAWSIFFDTNDLSLKMIQDTDKKKTMPCRCVYRDPIMETSMPECLDKEVYRRQ